MNRLLTRRTHNVLAAAVILAALCLVAGCATSGRHFEATGHGVPPMNADENEKRLASLQLAREDAWNKAYDLVRAEPAIRF